MIRSIRTALMAGLATIAFMVSLAACGGSPTSSSSKSAQATGTSPPPGAADSRICQVITQATAAYNAKNYTTWRNDLALVGEAADSAQYVPIKNYAEELKQSAGSTTTTKPKSKSKSRGASGVHLGGLFSELGAYVGLQRVCAKLPT
jgi:hypothetical protein